MCLLRFDGVSKKYPYEKSFLLEDVSFKVEEGENVGIACDVQCGKTTIVKMLAGLTKPTGGEIIFRGSGLKETPTKDMGLGVVFDDCALMPGKTALKNIEFPMKVRKLPDYREKALEAAKKFGLETVLYTKAKKLSAEDRLSVALARLSVRKLSLLALDGVSVGAERLALLDFSASLRLSSDIVSLDGCDRVYVIARGKTVFEGGFASAKEYIEQTRCFDKFETADE